MDQQEQPTQPPERPERFSADMPDAWAYHQASLQGRRHMKITQRKPKPNRRHK